MHYCIQVRVTLGKEGGDQPPPSHEYTGSLSANMFQDGLEEWITEAVVLALREAILFFGWWSLKEGIPLGDPRDVGFNLASPVNWARREAQVEMMVSTVQEGHQAIADAIMEKTTKARGPPRNNNDKPDPYNIKECMQSLEEGASKVGVKNGDASNPWEIAEECSFSMCG